MHRRIYLAIRKRDAEQARTLMDDHLRQAAMHHAAEARDAVQRRRGAARRIGTRRAERVTGHPDCRPNLLHYQSDLSN